MIPTVSEIETRLGAQLPSAYRDFLDRNATECDNFDPVLLYGRGALVERNETHQVQAYCPGCITIGNDGGDMEFILPLAGGPVSMVDAGSMRPEGFEFVAEDFSKWLAAGCPIPQDELDPSAWPVDPLTPVCIYLERRPADLRNLLQFKETFGVQASLGDLKRRLDAIPCLFAEGFAYAGARVRCNEANAIEPCLGIRLAADHSVRLPVEYPQ